MSKNSTQKHSVEYPEQSAVMTGILGRCPRCGKGKLYQSWLQPVDTCAVCDLDMSFAEEGDGPAVLVILVLGGVVTALALALENLFHPPLWVHFTLWPPVTVFASIYALRAVKGIMISAKYKTLEDQEQ